MTAYSLKYAQENLERIAKESVASDQATYITLDSGESVVIVSSERYESWNETDYLLSNPVNAERLLKAAADIRAGKFQRRELIEP
jgi:antitoxin YefM